MERHFPEFPKKKKDNLTRYTQIFQKIFFPKVFFPFNFAPGFSVEWFAFRKFNSFRNFWKLFREISVPFTSVSKFRKFWLNGKRLWLIVFPPTVPLHFYSFPSSVLSFLLFSLLVLISIFIFSLLLLVFVFFFFFFLFSFNIFVFPHPSPPLFYCFLSSPPHFFVFPPPPPPPPHFYCFPSTTTTFLLFFLHHHISLSFRHPHQRQVIWKVRGPKPGQKNNK